MYFQTSTFTVDLIKKFFLVSHQNLNQTQTLTNLYYYCGGSKTWALAVGLSTTFYQQYVRGEEIIRKPRN